MLRAVAFRKVVIDAPKMYTRSVMLDIASGLCSIFLACSRLVVLTDLVKYRSRVRGLCFPHSQNPTRRDSEDISLKRNPAVRELSG